MVASLWIHILGLALLRYVPPVAQEPLPAPVALEIELPAWESPDSPAKPIEPGVEENTAGPTPEPPPQTMPQPHTEPGPAASPGAPEEETISLESTAPKYLSYLGQVKAGIKNHWIFPPAARKEKATGKLTALITIANDGRLLDIKVESSSGRPILDSAALEAVRGADPFPPFPEHIQVQRLNIRASFDYRIKYIGVK